MDSGSRNWKAGAEADASEARFRTIYENAPFMINSFDRDGRVVLWNRACSELLGYSLEEMQREADPLALFYPDTRQRDAVVDAIQNPDGQFREWEVRRRDGRSVYQMWANYELPDRSLISVGYDVTAIREARRHLQEAKADLERKVEERTRELDRERERLASASKLAALGEMAGGIAHEINNPLAIIAGLVEQLQNGRPSEPVRQEMLADVRAAVVRIKKIVSGLRAISRDGSRDPREPAKIQDVVAETLGICRERFAHYGIALEEDLRAPSLVVHCRPVEIGQVLLNLLNNAFDAVAEARGPRVLVQLTDEGDDVVIRVSDNGGGVSESLRDKIFQPFFTTKPIGKGTGIGLSISRGIAESHGGTLDLECAEGSTSFVLRIPRV
jgi:PAS domain S-box-containing protein